MEQRKCALRGQGKGEGDAAGREVQCPHARGCPASARAVGAAERAGSPFCCCRVIYDMRESHCLDPSCIFPRALPLFPDPRCAAATVRLLWGCSPSRGYAGQSRGGLPAGPDPSGAPSPLPQPSRPTCRGPGNGAFGPSKFTATGGIQLPEGRGGAAGSGAFGSILPSFSAPAMSSVHTDPPSLSPPDKCAHK